MGFIDDSEKMAKIIFKNNNAAVHSNGNRVMEHWKITSL